jgi:hypothetical protein
MAAISRRSFMQVAGLSALGAASPAVLAEAIAACASTNLFITFDIVVLPTRPSALECGADEPGLWLVIRPMIFVRRSKPGSDDGLASYFQAIDTGEGLSPALWNCPCDLPAAADLMPMHVNLPTNWQLRLVAYDAKGSQIDALRKRIDRASRLKIRDWDALQVANRPPIAGLPLRLEKPSTFAASANGAPYVKAFNAQLRTALEGEKTPGELNDSAESVLRVLEQTDLTLSHGTRRYIRPGRTIDWQADDGLMVLRRSTDGVIETNTHSLLGLAIRLDTGATAAELASVARLGFAFSDDAESPAESLATPSDPLPGAWCDTNVASDLAALTRIFQQYATTYRNCASFTGVWDPDTGAGGSQPPLNQTLLAGRVLHGVKVLGSVPGKPALSICIPAGDSRANPARGPLRGLVWFSDPGADPATEAEQPHGAIHDAWVCRASPYRKFGAYGDGQVYRLIVRDLDRASFLSRLEQWRTNDTSPQKNLVNLGDLSPFVWLLPATPNGEALSLLRTSNIIVRQLPWDDPSDKHPEQLLLLVDKPLPVSDIYLVAQAPYAQAAFASDTATLAVGKESPDRGSARTSSWLIPGDPLKQAPTLVAMADTSGGRLATRLHFEFRDDVSLHLAQSQSSVLGRLKVSHACGSAEEVAREVLLGDRKTFVALNIYEAGADAAPAPVEGAYQKDPIIQSAPSPLRWLNPHVELYPMIQERDANAALKCSVPSAAACAVDSSYWFQIKEPFEFGPQQFAQITKSTPRAAPPIDSDAADKTYDPVQLVDEGGSGRVSTVELKQGVSPDDARAFIRTFFQQTYARAMRGARPLLFRVEGTFGWEAEVKIDPAAAPTVNTPGDWPVANAAEVWTSPTQPNSPAQPLTSESLGRPFLRSSWSDRTLTVELDEGLLTPPLRGPSTQFTACLDAWQAVAEIAGLAPEHVGIVLNAYRFKRSDSAGPDDLVSEFEKKRVDVKTLPELGTLSAGIRERCRKLIGGTALPTSVQQFKLASIAHPDVRRAHAISVDLELRRESSMAPHGADDPDDKRWQDWRVGYPGASAMATLEAKSAGQDTPKPDRIVAAAPNTPLDGLKTRYLEERTRSIATLPRWPRLPRDLSATDTNVRDLYTRAFADLLRAENVAISQASEWHILPPSIDQAEPSTVPPQPMVIPLVFRAPSAVMRQEWSDAAKGYGSVAPTDLFGEDPYQAVARLCGGLQSLMDGECSKDRSGKDTLLLGLHAASQTIEGFIDTLAEMVWPAFDPDALQFDKTLSEPAKERVRARMRALQTEGAPERLAVVQSCREALREDPSLYAQSRVLLYVEASNESAPLPSDFAQTVIALRYRYQSGDSATLTKSLILTAPVERRLRWGTADLKERVAAVLPLTDSDIGSEIDVLWLRLERFEGKLQTFVGANGKNPTPIRGEYLDVLDVNPDKLAIPCAQKDGSWTLNLPARAPVGDLQVAFAGTSRDGQSDFPAAMLISPLLKGTMDPHSGPEGTTAYLLSDTRSVPIALRSDQYLARFVLEMSGDASEGRGKELKADTLHMTFQPAPPVTPPPPPAHPDVNSPISELLRIQDVRKYANLQVLVLNRLLGANSLYAPDSVCKSARTSLCASNSTKSTYDLCQWPCIQLADLSKASVPGPHFPAPGVVRCAVYRKGKVSTPGDGAHFLVIVDVLLSRWSRMGTAFQQFRNGMAGSSASASRFNGVFQTHGQERLGSIAPLEGAEVGARLPAADKIPRFEKLDRKITADVLLRKLADQLYLSDPDGARNYQLSITVSHAQRIEMNDFLVEQSPGTILLSPEAYVPLNPGHWVLDPKASGQPDSYNDPFVVGGSEESGVRALAVDLEWRNSANVAVLRINHARIDVPSA